MYSSTIEFLQSEITRLKEVDIKINKTDIFQEIQIKYESEITLRAYERILEMERIAYEESIHVGIDLEDFGIVDDEYDKCLDVMSEVYKQEELDREKLELEYERGEI